MHFQVPLLVVEKCEAATASKRENVNIEWKRPPLFKSNGEVMLTLFEDLRGPFMSVIRSEM
jgi:hypothetical protein